MRAIIHDRGRQYVVHDEEQILIDHRPDLAVGDEVVFDNVLAVGEAVGAPYVNGARVVGTVTEQGKGRKLHVVKFKRRKDYRRKQGHRQQFTRIAIATITG